MSAQHTPGPWKFRLPSYVPTRPDKGGDFPIVKDGEIIAEVFNQSDDDKLANARLIAHAPEMYELLQRASVWLAKGIDAGIHMDFVSRKDLPRTLHAIREVLNAIDGMETP